MFMAIMIAVVFVTGCNNNQTLEEKAQDDMVSLFKSIARVPNSVKITNIVPYINCDSIYCCTCHVETDNTDGTSLNTVFDYTLVKYKEDNGEISYYNYINDLSRPDQKRQDRWFKDYFYDENIREESNNKYQTPEEFMMYMIYTSADVQNRAMKHKYSLN